MLQVCLPSNKVIKQLTPQLLVLISFSLETGQGWIYVI